jgi:predicted membrane-bound spermidine synthase
MVKEFRIPRPREALYPLFMLSGFCGLIYESIWSHYLKIFLGHAAYAQTVVLVVFIGGMAIGAWLCGRFAQRVRNPLLLYAAAEFLIGMGGLVFHSIFVASTDWAYASLLPATCGAEGWCVSSWVLAALLILPQSILLGTTFPLMTAGVLRIGGAGTGKTVALLYFLNSFGAVLGVLATAFLLIPTVGLPGATTTAGALNGVLAVIVYLIARTSTLPTAAVREAEQGARPASPFLLLAIASLTGLSSFVYEIVWIRMLSLVLGSSIYSFELMLASFILGLALGSAWIRGRIARLVEPLRFLAYVQIAMGVLALGTIGLYNWTFDIMAWMLGALQRTDSGYVLFTLGSSLIAMAIMLPATFLAGMTLPLITYVLLRGGYGERSIGYVYSWNTIGSIVGVILAVHFGLPLAGVRISLITAAGIDVALGFVILASTRKFQWLTPAGAGVAAALAIFVAGAVSLHIDPYRTASGVFRYGKAALDPAKASIEFQRDGKSATIAVVRYFDSLVTILTNGKPDAGMQTDAVQPPYGDELTMAMLGLVPLAHNPRIRTAANIGFGSGMTSQLLLGSSALTRLDNIEIEPAIFEGAKKFGTRVDRAYTDPRSHIVFDDAKSYFARNRRKYDLIVSEPSNPWVSGVASLFTEEFYGRVRTSLSPEGLFVQWVQTYEFTPRLVASISSAMGTVFRDYVVYLSQGDIIFVARADGPVDPIHREIFAETALRGELSRLGLVGPIDLETRRIATKQTLQALLFNEVPPVNSDYFPFVEYEAPRAWFKGEAASKVTQMRVAPIPVLDMLEHRAWNDSGPVSAPAKNDFGAPLGAYEASIALRRYVAEIRHDGSNLALGTTDPAILAALRATFVSCAPMDVVAPLWDQIVELAAVNSLLPPTQLDPFWSQLAAAPCLHRLPDSYRQWIALFRAAGDRDYAAMRRYAEQLLDGADPTPKQLDYLLYAAMAGSFMMNDQGRMRALADQWMPMLPEQSRRSPWLRTLRAMSGG